MKAIIALLIAVIICMTAVNAIEALPKGACFWTRSATEYRPERTFQGVWGRYSDGSIKCFSPGNSKPKAIPPKITAPVCTESTTTIEVCETENVCDEPCCHWKWECTKWAHVGCIKSHFIWFCKEPVCHDVTTCHIESVPVITCS